ncbi:MAG: DUF6580 family putative transport protein [Chitinophagaceae bacterium]
MKLNNKIVFSLCVLVVVAALYRLIPERPLGFAPQIAMAIFGGSLFVADKKWAFVMPLLSMFISDCLFAVLHAYGLSVIGGFYGGQITNYLLFAGLVVFGFFVKNNKVGSILTASLAAPTAYFLVSNFLVWINGGGYHHPKTFAGMMQCYTDALPFYGGSIASTILFSAVFFGGWRWIFGTKTAKSIA